MILKKAHDNAEGLRQAGRRAIEKAHRAGAPAYYMDKSLGAGIIKELPDGARQKIEMNAAGEQIIIETYGKRN